MQMHPYQVIQLTQPLVAEMQRRLQAGAPATAVLTESTLAGYLIGRGAPPQAAAQTLRQWAAEGILVQAGAAPPVPVAPPVPAAPPPVPAPTAAPTHRELVPHIERFMKDEASAAAFYAELMALAEDPMVKDFIDHAREDEEKHYRMLGELYRELTGRTYEVGPDKVEYAGLREGLKIALDDELEAAEEYRDVYLSTKDQRIRDLFFELMTDEMEHATRFTFSLQMVR